MVYAKYRPHHVKEQHRFDITINHIFSAYQLASQHTNIHPTTTSLSQQHTMTSQKNSSSQRLDLGALSLLLHAVCWILDSTSEQEMIVHR